MSEDQKHAESIVSIIKRDLETKLSEYINKRFEIDEKYIELSQIKKDIYKLKNQKTTWEDDHPDLVGPSPEHVYDPDGAYETEAFKDFGIVEESHSDKGAAYLKKYKSEFSRILRKEFNKLGVKKKRELFKTGLLKVRFYLNYYKYAKNKEKGKETELDKYVFKRSENFPYYLNIKFNDETMEKLKKIKETESENSKLEQDDRDYEIEELETYEDSEFDFSIDFEDDEDSYN